MQKQLRHVTRQTMHVVARLREVVPRKLLRLNEREYLRVNHGAQRFDRVPHERIAPLFVGVKVADREAQALRRKRLGEPPRCELSIRRTLGRPASIRNQGKTHTIFGLSVGSRRAA
jgi:hypothetical protein